MNRVISPYPASGECRSRCMGGEAQTRAFLRQLPSLPNPLFLISEAALRRNLSVIDTLQREAGVECIVALKAFSHYPLFPLLKPTVKGMAVSSVNECRLAQETFGGEVHVYAPVYSEAEFPALAAAATHVTFNSISQYQRYIRLAEERSVSCGIRINPEWSPVETDLYNPCVSGSRLGVTADTLAAWPDSLPFPQGLHCHNLCESGVEASLTTLQRIEAGFGSCLDRVQWLNLGGGHLITQEGYPLQRLIDGCRQFRRRHPHVQLIFEPGSAFFWETGVLVAQIEDIVSNGGIQTALLNISFSCHLPDCLEMPYLPRVWGTVPEKKGFGYRFGGCSCLAGDFTGDFYFERPLSVGDYMVFDDMAHYTMVKNTTFNGVARPTVGLLTLDGTVRLTREYRYEDYRCGI